MTSYDSDELTVINGPPLLGLKPLTTPQLCRRVGIKSTSKRQLNTRINRWDWHFQMKWNGKINP